MRSNEVTNVVFSSKVFSTGVGVMGNLKIPELMVVFMVAVHLI